MAFALKNKDKRLTVNFTTRDFECNCDNGCGYTYIDNEFAGMLERLKIGIEVKIGNPVELKIIKGFVCPESRKAEDSLHTLGKAAHITVLCGGRVIAAKTICSIAHEVGFSGIILLDENSVHIDTRLGTRYYFDCTAGIMRRDWEI